MCRIQPPEGVVTVCESTVIERFINLFLSLRTAEAAILLWFRLAVVLWRDFAPIHLHAPDVISHEETGILRRRIERQDSLQGRKTDQQVRRSMATKGKAGSKPDTGANLGFEAKLWQMADGLRNNMDAAEYKHVVLGLIFLKYISAFQGDAGAHVVPDCRNQVSHRPR